MNLNLFDEIAKYFIRKELVPVKDKVIVARVDKHWLVAVNGRTEDAECMIEGTPIKIPVGHAYISFNGYPAGLMCIDGSGTICAGEVANAETFVAALREA